MNRTGGLLIALLAISCTVMAAVDSTDPALKGWWAFEDTSTMNPLDAIGTFSMGIQGETSRLSYVDGKLGKGLHFDTAAIWADAATSPASCGITGWPLSITAWVKTDVVDEAMMVLSFGDKGQPHGVGLGIQNGSCAALTRYWEGEQRWHGTTSVADTQWHFLAMSIDADTTDTMLYTYAQVPVDSADSTIYVYDTSCVITIDSTDTMFYIYGGDTANPVIVDSVDTMLYAYDTSCAIIDSSDTTLYTYGDDSTNAIDSAFLIHNWGRIYTDGVEETSLTYQSQFSRTSPFEASKFPPTYSLLTLGRWQRKWHPSWYFKGTMDEVRLFSRALSQAEVIEVMNSTELYVDALRKPDDMLPASQFHIRARAGLIHIFLPGDAAAVALYTPDGRRIVKKEIKSQLKNIAVGSHLSSGLYIVSVKNSAGNCATRAVTLSR
jgi:hypothetical protein